VIVALALLLVWRCVLRPAARELSPRWLAERLPAAWDSGAGPSLRETFGVSSRARSGATWRAVILLVLSLAIGIASHIVWDLFTHEARWGSTVIPALAELWGPLPGFKWLQHGSSVVGLLVLGIWMLVWLRRRVPDDSLTRVLPSWVRWVWWISLPAALVGAWAWGLVAFGPLDQDFTVAHLAYRVLPPTCALWGAGTVALCITVQLAGARRRPAVQAPAR
jgi:hypothetical protein